MSRNDPRILAGTALITGAGTGLGRALAVRLCKQGMTVLGLGRRTEALETTAKEAGISFFPTTVDISDFNALRVFFRQLDEHPPLTLLINNAATFPHRDFIDETPESFMETMTINFGGTLAATRLAIDHFIESGFGRILNVATFADLNPLPTASAYSTSKGANRILTRALVADLADRFPDIVFTDWMPGMLATEMGIPDGLSPAQAALWGVDLALWHDRSLNGSTFEQDSEVPPARGLKARLKNALLLQSTKPRKLGQ